MRKSGRKILKRIGSQDLSQVLKCVNTLQQTPFRVNNNILEVLYNVWQRDIPVSGLVSREQIEREPYPFDVDPRDMDKAMREELKVWRGRQNAILQQNAKQMSKRLQIERTIQLAFDYTKRDKFYYVTQLDFRSRMYYVSDFMTPQSADYGKALLEFALGIEIKQEEDARWLAIHGANTYGEDKISLDDREQWAYENSEDIMKSAENPYDYAWWMAADKPFQFLAFCYEWSDYIKALEKGGTFITQLPVSADGSCNGLQHLSAILRDEQGGRATNLIPSNLPNDIYSDVALEVQKKVEVEAAQGNELAKQILEFGIDRKLTKRPVMIVPYNGTRFSCRDYIEQAIKEKVEKGVHAPFDTFDASLYLSNHVWDSISVVISSARKVMDFVGDIGKAYAEKKIPMEWMTPLNFLVVQDYPDLNKRRIKTWIDGGIVTLVYRDPIENTVSKKDTVKAAAPNFIHSLDASALMRTVNTCVDHGISQFAMVHDSYGAHSPELPRMQEILRHEFYAMYEENDVLDDLRDHAITTLGHDNLPDCPSRGSLDLKQVLKSDYFFA